MPVFTTVIDDLAFPEGPRWHGGALWFSDMHDGRVIRWEPGGAPETVVRIDDCPSGLGFLPDGRLLVVSMHSRQVLSVERDGSTRVHADLSDIATWHANDMLVDSAGRAYVGNFGDASAPPEPITPATLVVIDPDGGVTVGATDLHLPNGMALIDGGSTLVVAETRALPPQITTFAVGPDGALSDRKVLIELADELPDGLAVDDNDDIWFASPFTGELIKISPAGDILYRLASPRPPYACALGGPSHSTLYVCVADDWDRATCREQRSGGVLAVEVAGL
ncbi:SMP-30/gluconolactonase/LRE family protein [Dietzia alimentaria]|uniref:SMP-30/gluconolactonase/LRE family protein n=1 Tax=Dietzia alimentaria TaxID=665550 RepID=UPI00029A29AF|nr:SMP-30/gluconolactonase/LRE family protein [Dietzia alimentaria]